MIKYSMLLAVLCSFLSSKAENTPPPLSNQVCVGIPYLLSNIVISEESPTDFNVVGSGTIVLNAAAGTFIMGGENVQIEGSASLSATISVTSTKITITLTESDNDNASELNTLTVSGLTYIINTQTETQISYSAESSIEVSNLVFGEAVSHINSENLPFGSSETVVECSNISLFYDLGSNLGTAGSVPANFVWSAIDNPNVEGESTSTNSNGYITDAIINQSGTSQQVQYTITPTSYGGCTGNPFTVTFTINPEPVLIITNNKPTIPSGGTTDIQLSSDIVGSTFNFNGSGTPNVSGIMEGTGSVISQTLGNSVGAAQLVQYYITALSPGGCASKPSSTVVKVSGFPSVVVSDSLALVALYNATNGQAWTQSAEWLSGGVDTWHGITVSASRVIGISLIANDVIGSLPTEIGDLTALTSLEITGSKGNGLTGVIPSQIGGLVNLTQLNLSGNALTSLPTQLATLTNLTSLQLSQNKFSGAIPSLINTLSKLTLLDLSDNEFTGAVPNFSGIVGPVTIQLNRNNLTSIPSLTGWNFDVLDIAHNLFTFEDIEPIESIPNINYAPQKPFSPESYQKLGSGETFTKSFVVPGSDNSYQWLKGDEPLAGQTSNTITISNLTTENSGGYILQVTSSLVPSLTLQNEPVYLTVSPIYTADSLGAVAFYNSTNGAGWVNKENWLTGNFDTWYGLTISEGRVAEIILQDNNLTGTLPSSIGGLSDLTYLELGSTEFDHKSTNPNRNKMSGSIPASIGGLSSLTYLNLSSNNFSGTLPTTFSGLTSLEELWLSGNELKLGSFPTEILSMTNLSALKLSYSGITGALPSSIQTLSLLQSLVLNNNDITSLPAELAALTNLQLLYLNKNKIVDLPDLKSLTTLSNGHVEDNQLTFEDLELNVGVPIIYIPQDSVGLKRSVLFQTGTPGTLTSSVGGSANVYQWKKNNVAIGGATSATYALPSPGFDDEGIYSFEVSNSIVTGLTLKSRPIEVKTSSLKRDSLALVNLYTATNGSAWKNKAGWLVGKLNTWSGITITSNRVTDINLANNGLQGVIPTDLSDIVNLTTVNFSDNKITGLPSLSLLSKLTSFNVSFNSLNFASLEANVSKLGIMNYTNQALIGVTKRDSLTVGSPYTASVITAGTNNIYQWKRNSVVVAGANSATYAIASLGKSTMGEYSCEITNSVVPGLQLKSSPQIVLAVTELSGKLLIESTAVAKGKVTLFRITPDHGYDTVKVTNVNASGFYKFEKVVLDNYHVMGFADASINASALPTYYKKTFLWEEADTLVVTGSMLNLDIVSELKPSSNPGGLGVIKGIVEEEINGTGGRTQGTGRVSNAGVSARRVEGNGRTKGETYILVAYVFTNSNGEFEIKNLPVGNYKLNIQYPGYPMDEKSFVAFPIGTGSESEVTVEALVDKNKITVRQLTITGIAPLENYQAEVYPIPSRDDIRIRFASQSPTRTVDMVDVVGRKVMVKAATEQNILLNVRMVERGVYILNINDKNDVVKKLRVVIE